MASSGNEVRFKCAYGDQLEPLFVSSPPTLSKLRAAIFKRFQRHLRVFYIDEKREQQTVETEQAFKRLVEKSKQGKPPAWKLQLRDQQSDSLRISGRYRSGSVPAERPSSPPPGSLESARPAAVARSSSSASLGETFAHLNINGGGEFIPEVVNVSEGHLTVRSTSSSLSGHSILSSDSLYSYYRAPDDEESGYFETATEKAYFDTVPRVGGHRRSHSLSETPRTFPRMRDPRQIEERFATDLSALGHPDSGRAHVPQVPKRWQRGKLLGAGGFGKVFLAHDQDTGKEFAVKQLDLGGQSEHDPIKEVKSLEEEISLLRNLRHNRIVTYLGTSRDAANLYIFMEYVPGRSIAQRLREYGAFSHEIVRKYTRQILEGLEYLHYHRIIHRDIKGANVLVDSAGDAKLADFGSSKRLQSLQTATGVRSTHGTFYWMAPEVVNGQGYGRRSDIWSLGCTVVEMMTTKPPFFECEQVAIVFKIGSPDVDFTETIPAHASKEGRHFLTLCFRRDKDKRPAAHELLSHAFVAA